MAFPAIVAQALDRHSQLSGFFAWWSAALRETVPVAWRKAWASRQAQLVLELEPQKARLTRRARGQDGILYDGPAAGLAAWMQRQPRLNEEVTVRLDQAVVLRRSLALPLAPEAQLDRIISNEIDRQTPFAAAQVDFDYRVTARDADARRLAIELVVVKRSIVDEALSTAERLGLHPAAVGICGDITDVPINLLRRRAQGASRRVTAYLNVGLAAVAMALAIAVVMFSLQRLDEDIVRLDAEVRHLRSQAQQADGLRREIARLSEEGNFLARRKAGVPSLAVLREVTLLLPDDAWTYEVHFTGQEVRLTGYARDASALIARFERSALFQNARFRAPVTRIANRDVDRFDLAADIRSTTGSSR